MKKNQYEEYWSGQTTPLHRRNDSHTYRAYAQELSNIFNYMGFKEGAVLELGCGNGALFPFFNFDSNSYLGIDFSSSMIGLFKEHYPNLSLIECDAATYVPNKKYDLIFGNAVHQNFSERMMTYNVRNMLGSLSPKGTFVMANVPYTALKHQFLYGELSPSPDSSFLRTLRYKVARKWRWICGQPDGIGFWYNFKNIKMIVGDNYEIEVFGSNFYPYRMHFGVKRS